MVWCESKMAKRLCKNKYQQLTLAQSLSGSGQLARQDGGGGGGNGGGGDGGGGVADNGQSRSEEQRYQASVASIAQPSELELVSSSSESDFEPDPDSSAEEWFPSGSESSRDSSPDLRGSSRSCDRHSTLRVQVKTPFHYHLVM